MRVTAPHHPYDLTGSASDIPYRGVEAETPCGTPPLRPTRQAVRSATLSL